MKILSALGWLLLAAWGQTALAVCQDDQISEYVVNLPSSRVTDVLHGRSLSYISLPKWIKQVSGPALVRLDAKKVVCEIVAKNYSELHSVVQSAELKEEIQIPDAELELFFPATHEGRQGYYHKNYDEEVQFAHVFWSAKISNLASLLTSQSRGVREAGLKFAVSVEPSSDEEWDALALAATDALTLDLDETGKNWAEREHDRWVTEVVYVIRRAAGYYSSKQPTLAGDWVGKAAQSLIAIVRRGTSYAPYDGCDALLTMGYRASCSRQTVLPPELIQSLERAIFLGSELERTARLRPAPNDVANNIDKLSLMLSEYLEARTDIRPVPAWWLDLAEVFLDSVASRQARDRMASCKSLRLLGYDAPCSDWLTASSDSRIFSGEIEIFRKLIRTQRRSKVLRPAQ